MGRRKWLYIALIFLVVGVISAVFTNALMFGPQNPTLNTVVMILTVVGLLGAAFSLMWWAILKRSEDLGKY